MTKKLLLTFPFCMIGTSGFALELTCEWLENEYVKLIDENNRVTSTYKSDEDWGDFRVSFFDNECMTISKSNMKAVGKQTKTDSQYTCRMGSSKEGDENRMLFFRKIVRVDRYTGKAEHVFYNKEFETKNIYQCEKSEKKF